MDPRIELVLGDITALQVDAVVNAANTSLLGGGGVDGAIHRAAGPQLLEECRELGGCESGSAKISKGYKLPAGHVIHTVGPVWHGGKQNEDSLLASCYETSMALLKQYHLKSIAFPAISCGVYRFPVERAATIALKTLNRVLEDDKDTEKVLLVCFSEQMFDVYRQILNNS